MWPTKVAPLDAMDLTRPELPPRSRLFALAPIGIGTERVESLSSYLTRLARAHAVNPRRMVRDEFLKIAPQLRYPARHTGEVGPMNGYGKYATTFVELAVQLTTRSEARYLTLLPLSDLLPSNGAGVIAREPRWCPECLAEMDEPFRPLVWTLELYQVCHQHRRQLVTACPSCHKTQPHLPTYPDLAHCAYCGKALSDSPRTPAIAPSDEAVWVAEALADLVAQLPKLDGVANRERFLAFINETIKQKCNGNKAAFAGEMGLSPWVFKNWRLRGERPSLPQLLRIAYGMETRPTAMFLSRPGNPGPLRRVERTQRPRSRENPQTPEQLRLAETLAGIAAASADLRSLAQLSRDLQVSISWLRYWFPNECATICRRRRDANQRALAERRAAEYGVVADVVRDMASRAEYPARRKVNEALARLHLSLAQPDMVEAYRVAVRETWSTDRLVAN